MLRDSIYKNISKAVEASQRTSVAPMRTLVLSINKNLKLIDEAIYLGSIGPAIYSFGDICRTQGKISSYIDIALTMGKIDPNIANIIESSLSGAINELVVILSTNLHSSHDHLS